MNSKTKKTQELYIAGPMTGMKDFNRPAFNAAAKFLVRRGFKPLNPAWLDHGEAGGVWEDYLKRDIPHLLKCDGVVVLPGWDTSRGAKLEVRVAREVGMPIFAIVDKCRLERVMFEENKIKFGPPIELLTSEPAQKESVLVEAERLINGDRNASYGPPNQDFKRTADMWTALLQYKLLAGAKLRPQDVAWMMIALKLSRAQHTNKRDNAVDIAGYAGCGQRCIDAE